MSVSPWVVGQTTPQWLVTLQDDSGIAVPLVGATLSGRAFISTRGSIPLTGSINVIDANNGKFSFQPSPTDFAVDGPYEVYFSATFPGGGVMDTDVIPVYVRPKQ